MITVVNKHWFKGDVSKADWIARPSALGNPFTHLTGKTLAQYVVKDRAEAISKYKEWLPKELETNPEAKRQFDALVEKYKQTGELTLICYCKPADCHGDILKEMIESRLKELNS